MGVKHLKLNLVKDLLFRREHFYEHVDCIKLKKAP